MAAIADRGVGWGVKNRIMVTVWLIIFIGYWICVDI